MICYFLILALLQLMNVTYAICNNAMPYQKSPWEIERRSKLSFRFMTTLGFIIAGAILSFFIFTWWKCVIALVVIYLVTMPIPELIGINDKPVLRGRFLFFYYYLSYAVYAVATFCASYYFHNY